MSGELMTVRFEGEKLDLRSMPIYELGTTLIAVQRIIYKADLFVSGRLEKGSSLPAKRRAQVSLQVVTHKKGSDLWGLAPYLTDPATGPIIQGLVVTGLAALAVYVGKKVKGDRRASEKNSPSQNQILIVNLFPEIKQLTDRIGNVGGVERIEIQSPAIESAPRLSIDSSTQEYVRKLEHELVPGRKSVISGTVTSLYPQSFRLDLKDAPGHYIHVKMDPDLFDKVRRLKYLTEREIRFEGIPLYKLGDERGGISEFRASRVILPRN